jgi:hypothetical protein
LLEAGGQQQTWEFNGSGQLVAVGPAPTSQQLAVANQANQLVQGMAAYAVPFAVTLTEAQTATAVLPITLAASGLLHG